MEAASEALLSPYRLPGWQLSNGHVVHSHMEAALCEHLAARAVPHDHSTLVFEVELAPERHATFIPEIVLTEDRKDGRRIIVEPIGSVQPGGGVRRLAAFRRQFGGEYFLVVVAKRVVIPHVPEDASDALVPLEDFSLLDALLQD